MKKISSFDIFDTVITRAVSSPEQIFNVIGRILQSTGTALPRELVKSFYSERARAELSARITSRKQDITINDIYDKIALVYRLGKEPVKFLIELEIMTELNYMVPIDWTVKKIKSLRQSGERIIFISDMYLPVSAMTEMLSRSGAYETGDGVYVSGDAGLSKATGDLYKYVLEKEDCRPSEMTHLGDDLHDDVYMPYRSGIQVYSVSSYEIARIALACRLWNLKNKAEKAAGTVFARHA